MSRTLRMLIIEDSERDAGLIRDQFERQGYRLEWRRVEEEGGFLKALWEQNWDLVIADACLPTFSGRAALEHSLERGLDVPFIIVSGTMDEESAAAAMKAGAHDFVPKGQLARLVPASEREMRDAAIRREQKQVEGALHALAAHLQSIREEERQRITRDLHDDLGSALTELKLDLASLRSRLSSGTGTISPEVLEKLGAMGRLIDSTSDNLRKLCAGLRPGILDDLGLAAAVEWQAHEFARRTGINCRVDVQAHFPRLASERSTAVFRVFQEILTNITRHAGASQVEVRLASSGGSLHLEVGDNGCGIRERDLANSGSFGLLGMRERAVALGGHLEIGPAALGGTIVNLEMPIS